MSSSFPSLPKPFVEHYFIIDGEPITKEAIENQYLEALEGVGSCLFIFPENDGRQKYRFYAVTSYKAPFPQTSSKGTRFCDWSYFTDHTTTNFDQSWWLYIEEGYTKQGFQSPRHTRSLHKDLEHVSGPRKEIRKRFFSQITRAYYEHKPEVIGRRVMGVGPLYGQPNFTRSLNIPFQKMLKVELDESQAKDVKSMLVRGISLLRSVTRWQSPSIGTSSPTMIDSVRGVQWQLIIAYSGFEFLFKGMYVLLTELPESTKNRLKSVKIN